MFWSRKARIQGWISYHGLDDWWEHRFKPDVRERLEHLWIEKLQNPRVTLLTGNPRETERPELHNPFIFLRTGAWAFDSPATAPQASSFMLKAQDFIEDGLERYMWYCEYLDYKYAEFEADPNKVYEAIQACEAMIREIPETKPLVQAQNPGSPLPPHYGYTQLVRVRKRQGYLDEAKRLEAEAARVWQ